MIIATSNGLAKAIALNALEKGHRVVIVSHLINNFTDLEQAGVFILDLSNAEPTDLKQATEEAIAKHGRVDILVNATDVAIEKAIEEATPEQMWDDFNTMFEMVCVTRAVLAFMRKRRSGLIVNFRSGKPNRASAGIHCCATKLACSALVESLRSEIELSGIASTVVEPQWPRSGYLYPRAYVSKAETERVQGE